MELAGGEERSRVDVRRAAATTGTRRAPEKPRRDEPAGREHDDQRPPERAGSRRFGAAVLRARPRLRCPGSRRLGADGAVSGRRRSGSGSGSAPSSGLACGYWSVRRKGYAFVCPAYRSAKPTGSGAPRGARPGDQRGEPGQDRSDHERDVQRGADEARPGSRAARGRASSSGSGARAPGARGRAGRGPAAR